MALFSHLATHARKVQQKEIVDEDGFTLVVRGGKYGRGVGAGGAVGVAERGWKGEDQGKRGGNKGKGRMKGELKGFYRWQVREEKREGKLNRFALLLTHSVPKHVGLTSYLS